MVLRINIFELLYHYAVVPLYRSSKSYFEIPYTQSYKCQGKGYQYQSFLPDIQKSRPLDHYIFYDYNKISRRKYCTDPSINFRHILDREDESGEQNCRQHHTYHRDKDG